MCCFWHHYSWRGCVRAAQYYYALVVSFELARCHCLACVTYQSKSRILKASLLFDPARGVCQHPTAANVHSPKLLFCVVVFSRRDV